jgi:hypothetical protein
MMRSQERDRRVERSSGARRALAYIDMKPLGPFRPERPPPPPKIDFWTATAVLGAVILGIGVALYWLHDSGTISGEAFGLIMVLVVAATAGLLVTADVGRPAPRDAQSRFTEIPPPFDVYMIWPPECGWIADPPSVNPGARHTRTTHGEGKRREK